MEVIPIPLSAVIPGDAQGLPSVVVLGTIVLAVDDGTRPPEPSKATGREVNYGPPIFWNL